MLFVQETELPIYPPSRNEVQITGKVSNKKESGHQVPDLIVFVVDDEAVTWRPGVKARPPGRSPRKAPQWTL
jgi:hypothetical protein